MMSRSVKGKPKKYFTTYKNFDDEKLEEKPKKHLSSVLDFESFCLACKTTLDQFAPLKQKVV